MLGLVLGSLLVLACAWSRGLSYGLILGVGLACELVAIGLASEKSRMGNAPRLHSSGESPGTMAGSIESRCWR